MPRWSAATPRGRFGDGFVAYPRANVVAVLNDQLGVELPDPIPIIHPSLGRESAATIELRKPLDDAIKSIGSEPFIHEGGAYFFGHGGYLELEVNVGRVNSARWTDGPKHSSTSLLMQKAIGGALVPIALLLLIQVVRVLRTRVTVSDEGIKWCGGRPPIPFESMNDLRVGKGGGLPPGVAVVTYKSGGGTSKLKLDSYVVKEQAAIVDAIREKTGLGGGPVES